MNRILVTGSRVWTDRDTIIRALSDQLGNLPRQQTVLVHGAARGADSVAAAIWVEWACVWPDLIGKVEPHRADWHTHGKAAGHIRNKHMVSLGADVCVAFPIGKSPGTRNCMAQAEAAGICVVNYGDAA